MSGSDQSPKSEESAGVAVEPILRELHHALALPEEETLDLMAVTDGTVTLSRRSAAAGAAAPVAPDLVADLETFPLASILRTLHADGRSGWLRLIYREHVKSVWLRRGEVIFANSNQRVDRIGECLLRAGVIQLDMLREAERTHEAQEPRDRFGKVLVELGYLTPRELWNGVKVQVEEIVRSLFAYASGQVTFWEGEREPDNVVRLSLPTARLVEEGLQRSDDLAKFIAMVRDPRVSMVRVEGHRGELAGNERAVADAIGAGRGFDDVCDILAFDPTSAARSIQLLRLVGAVKLMRLPDATGLEDLDASSPDRLGPRVASFAKWISELAAMISEADGDDAGIHERLARVLDDATGHFPALLTGIRIGAGATLDIDMLVDRASKLPGDREEQLVAALGELVAYLEFEVKNHPGIDDPDALLESLRRDSSPT